MKPIFPTNLILVERISFFAVGIALVKLITIRLAHNTTIKAHAYLTDKDHNLELVNDIQADDVFRLPERSICTMVFP